MNRPDEWESLPKEDRRERALAGFESLILAYSKREKDWFALALMEVGGRALAALVDALRVQRVGGPDWRESFATIEYRVGWNWDLGQRALSVWDEAALATRDACNQMVVAMAVEAAEAAALLAVTGSNTFVKEGDRYRVCLAADARSKLEGVSGERREDVLDEILRPFSLGSIPWRVDAGGLEDGAGPDRPDPVLTHEEAAALARFLNDGERARNGEGFRFEAVVGGRRVAGSVCLMIEPLALDPATRRAWHPVTVGIEFDPGVDGHPADWGEGERSDLVDELLRQWDASLGRLGTRLPGERAMPGKRDEPAAFRDGVARVPANPLTVKLATLVYAAGPGWADRPGAWEASAETGGPISSHVVRRLDGRVVITVPGGGNESGWSIVGRMDAHTLDVALLVLARLTAGGAADDPAEAPPRTVVVTAKSLLRDMGIRHAGARRREAILRIGRDLDCVSRLACDISATVRQSRGGRRRSFELSQDRLFSVVESREEDLRLPGVATTWIVRIGEWCGLWLRAGSAVWLAGLPRALFLLPRNGGRGASLLAKRIGTVLMMESAYMPRRRSVRVRTLLSLVGEMESTPRMRYRLRRLQERFDAALELLQEREILRSFSVEAAGWACAPGGRGWSADWLDSTVELELCDGKERPLLGRRRQGGPRPARAAAGQELWETVRATRLARSKSQRDVACELEITPAFLCKLERGALSRSGAPVAASSRVESRARDWIARNAESMS